LQIFWDSTGGIWQTGGFWGKYVSLGIFYFFGGEANFDLTRHCGLFISTGTQGGGQESTAIAAMSTLAHHGIIYVPLGYKLAFPTLANLSEARGGSPWGAGTFASADGSRQPSKLELELAETQGKAFYNAMCRVNHSA